MKSKCYQAILSIIAVFTAIVVPSLHVPMQSDDFAYYSLGLSIDAQLVHYMGWSGRIVTNTISSYLLNLFPHDIYEVINSVVFSLLVFFISAIPKAMAGEARWPSPLVIILIFALYWIANPALGETSFWIVGSTNYLWTSMFVCLYFFYIFSSEEKPSSKPRLTAALILGFLAGCSNENVCLIVVMISGVIFVFERQKTVALYGLLGAAVGSAVLLFSPGNASRARSFVEWKSLSFGEKFTIHFFERFPEIMSGYWQVYLVLALTLVFAAFVVKGYRKNLAYAGVFLVGAVLSNAAFVGSPFVPERAANGALVLMLISLSLAIHSIIRYGSKKLESLYFCCALGFILVYFVPSYVMFSQAVSNVWSQSRVREAMILDAKARGADEVKVPAYYYTKLLKPSDKLASFDNNAVDYYYGLKKIEYYPVSFNYADLKKVPRIDTHLVVGDGVIVDQILLSSEAFGRNGKLLFGIDGDIDSYFKKGAAMYIHIFMKDGSYLNRDTASPAISLGQSKYLVADLGNSKKEIDRIEMGLYMPTSTISNLVVANPKFTTPD